MLLNVFGCATTYQGPDLDLSLKGEKAQKEIKQFSLKEGYWSQGNGGFVMGPSEQRYTFDSVRPFILKVSPGASHLMSKAETQITISRIALGVADGLILWAIFSPNTSTQQILVPTALVSLGVGATFSIKAFSNLSSAAEQYNRDLQTKLSPQIGFNFSY